MLKINFSPVRADREQVTAHWADPVLTVDGEPYDLSELGDGDDAEHEVLQKVERTGDDYEVTFTIYHGAKAPEATRFPLPLMVASDGSVAVPEYDVAE